MRQFGRATLVLLALGAPAWTGGCEDGSSTGPGVGLSASTVLASDTVRAPLVSLVGSVASTARAAAEGTLYISVAPGTVSHGSSVEILNVASGFSWSAPLAAGGFDPVPVPASVGDALELTLYDGAQVVSRTRITAKSKRPPRVVRTSPPPRKRDVPLNATIVVVFSEPIDPSSVTASAMRLLRGSTPVPGRLELHGDDRLSVAFVPDSPLAARATYSLLVTEDVRDLDGDALEEAVRVEFETGSEGGDAANLWIDQTAATLAPGEQVWLFARLTDGEGHALNVPITWSSADPDVATVDAHGVVRALALGSTTVTTRAGALSASTTIDVSRLTFASVDAGGEHSCGLTTDGSAYCWGHGMVGQLGAAQDTWYASTPVPVSGDLEFEAISAGGAHACGLTQAGEAYCWGEQGDGALGAPAPEVCDELVEPDRPCSRRPLPVAGGLRFSSISAGMGHTCAITTTEIAYCWGDNSFGALGDGSTVSSTVPVAVGGDLRFASISAGERLTCGITTGGAAHCWGLSHWYGPPFTYAALGDGSPGGPELCAPPVYGGTTFPCSTTPVAVAGGITFTTISAGWLRACALDAGGIAYCWGEHPDRPDLESAVPRVLRPGTVHRGISAPPVEGIACALEDDGDPYCWGLYLYGESDPRGEDGIGGTYAHEPRLLPGDVRLATLSTSWSHGCGLGADGAAYCWGLGLGGLGNGSRASHAAPRRVLGQQ